MTARGPRRFREQRWLLDLAVRTDGIEWDQARIGYTARPAAPDIVPDLRWVEAQVRRYDDLMPVFEIAAERREMRARAADDAGLLVQARESYFIAALLYLSACWPIFENNDRLVALNEKKNLCYGRWGELASHHVERVEIPFEGRLLPAWFHLPARFDGEPLPTVLVAGGMDAFKEVQVSMYGDKLLERGFAVLAVDGPGQGESPILGVYTTERNWIDAGHVLVEWLVERAEVDSERIVAMGSSFGSFWMTQVAATQPLLKGCAVALPCHEPGCHTLFNEASPTFKARYMWMSDIADEDEFDAFAHQLDLRELVTSMDVPWLCLGGESDELSPIRHTYELAARIPSPASLMIYEGAGHGIAGAASSTLGPDWRTVAADWLVDRAAGVAPEEVVDFVARTGHVERREHPKSSATR